MSGDPTSMDDDRESPDQSSAQKVPDEQALLDGEVRRGAPVQRASAGPAEPPVDPDAPTNSA